MMPPKKISGKNIYLGPVSKESVPRIVKWMNDLEVVKYTCQAARMHTEETAKDYLEKMLHDPKSYYFGIYLNEGSLIGACDLKDVDSIQRIASLGIIIGEKEHWSKGYGEESIRLLAWYGFKILNLNNIMLQVFESNPRAIRCYEKAGFKMIGKRRKSRYYEGKYLDEIYMDMLAEEFDITEDIKETEDGKAGKGKK